MKQMLVDVDLNIMMFDGKKTEPLGRALPFQELIKDKLYAINDDFYIKSNDEYKLIAENADAFRINSPMFYADRQFTRLSFDEQHDMFVYLDPKVHYTKLCPPEYIHIFYQNGFPLLQPNRVLIQKGKNEHVMCYTEGRELSICDDKAVGNEKALFWHGGLYNRLNDFFVQVPIVIEYQNDTFMIIRDDHYSKSTFAVFASGEVKLLGVYKNIVKTDVSTLLALSEDDFMEIWHLGENFLERIVSSPKEDNVLEVNQDGSIIHSYRTDVGSDNGGIVDGSTIYRLNEKGHYVGQ